MLDRDLVRRKLTELAELVTQVPEFRDVTVERYRAEWKTQRIVVHEYARVDAAVVVGILRDHPG